MDEISRFNGLNDGLRYYAVTGHKPVLSVTTVIGEFLDEDDTGLTIWKARNTGKHDQADHEHLLWYKTYRGTLCHYQALSIFEDKHDGDIWGDGEREALNAMLHGPDSGKFDDASHDTDDILYSILKDHEWVHSRQEFSHRFHIRYCTVCNEAHNTAAANCPNCGSFMRKETSNSIIDVHDADADWFVNEFERMCNDLGVDDDSVIAVEHFLLNTTHGYGGQCDMIYEDENGDTVVVDLKTSSGLRLKHRLQAVAYMKAVEEADDLSVDSVDRMEVWRLHPDSQTAEVHANEVPSHAEDYDWYTDEGWLVDPWGDFEYESVEAQWEHFKSLVEMAQ